MQLPTAIEGFWLSRQRNLSPSTVSDYTYTYNRLQRYLLEHHAIVDIEAVTHRHIHQFLAWCADHEHLAPKTVLNHWIALSALWTWAETELQLPHIIRGRVDPPRYRRNQPDPYTEDQVRAMLAACDLNDHWRNRPGIRSRRATARRDRAILLVLLDTGLRASELCHLQVGDYDRATGRLVVQCGKGGKQRSVYCGYAARSALWRYLENRARLHKQATGNPQLDRTMSLFVTASGLPISRDNLLHMIQAIGRRAGVPDATVHRWRHTFALNALRNGMSPFALQELLGHSDMETVRLYLKLVDRDLRTAVVNASPADTWRL